jgi:hypothetical protein
MYISFASPRECSGSHASSSEAAALDVEVVEEEVEGRSSGAGFCCSRAMYPGMLSLEDGVGCT